MKNTKMEGGQSGTYLRQTRASSGPLVSVAKTYRDETKQKCKLSGQITVAFLSSTIEETKSKLISAAGVRVEFGGLTDVETWGVSGLEDELVRSLAADVIWGGVM